MNDINKEPQRKKRKIMINSNNDNDNNDNDDNEEKENDKLSLIKFANLKLPINVDIIRHPKEAVNVCSSVHACIVAPNYVKMYEFPTVPDYTNNTDGIFLLYPIQDYNITELQYVNVIYTGLNDDGYQDVVIKEELTGIRFD